MSEPRRVETWAIAALFAAFAAALVQVDSDPDIWGRLAYARDALATHQTFLALDPYSYTAPGAPWIDHEWGFSWIAWAAFRLAGWMGLRLLRVVPFAAAAALCFRADDTPAGIRMLLGVAAGVPLAMGFVGPRAQELSYLLFAWMLFCFARARTRGERWVLFGVLPLPLWINLHGGYLAGAAAALVWCGLELVFGRNRRACALAIAVVAVSALCSRYGPGYLGALVREALIDRPWVPEWHAPSPLSIPGVCWLMMALTVLVAARARPRIPADLAVLAATAAASALHQRHLTFFAIALTILGRPRQLAWDVPPSAFWRAMGASSAAALVMLSALTLARARRPAPAEPAFPARAVAFLRDQHLSGGLLVDFNWAQYALYELWPQVHVAFDGRYEAVYPPAVREAYFAWHYGTGDWPEFPKRPDTRLALVEANSDRAGRLSVLPDWRRIYQDDRAEVFERVEEPPP